MSVTQTVEIPPSHRLTIDVPREVPAGPVMLTFTPASGIRSSAISAEKGKSADAPAAIETIPEASKGQSKDENFRRVIRQCQGAWADNPWENCIKDIRAMREEWNHRDPWNPEPAKRHRD